MHYVHESEIAAPPQAVFAFHERPEALALLVPPWEKVVVVQPPSSLAPGTRVLLKMKLGPLSVTWEAEHTLYEKNVLFQDRMVRGPFAKWVHTHRFLPSAGGTLLRDEVELALPFGPLGLLGWPLARRRLEKMFAYRHAKTREAVLASLPDKRA